MIHIRFTLFLVAISIGNQVFCQTDHPVINNALLFLDTPYTAHTLEVGNDEELVVNLEEVDCTTYVEYVLAMSLSGCKESCSQDSAFLHYLQQIRYRNGAMNGYTSRLHYFSEWIENGVNKGFLQDITSENCMTRTPLSLSYMSTHPDQYKQLKNSPEKVMEMKAIEDSLNGKSVCWLPKEMAKKLDIGFIKEGDIIAFTTNIQGLDIAHVGFATYNSSNEIALLHASLNQRKVVVENQSINQLLISNKRWTGLRVLRLK